MNEQEQAAADAAAAQAAADAAASQAAADIAAKGKKQVKARVLVTGNFGKVNEVVSLSAADAKAGTASGDLDTAPAAVAYAESLVVVVEEKQ